MLNAKQDLLQMVRLFISEWDRRCDWLQTTAEHDVIWSIWAGDHGELSCTHLNREWQFHAKSRADRGLFGLSTWLSTRSSTAMRQTRSSAARLPDNYTCLADSLQQTVDASKFPIPVCQFIQQSLCILLWQKFVIRITCSCEIFLISFNFYWYSSLDSFPR